MADYSPIHTSGLKPVPLTCSAAVVGGQLVEVSGNGTIAPSPASATASPKVIGVAAHDCGTGMVGTVWPRGMVHETTANGVITAGDQLVSGAVAGTVKTMPVTASNFAAAYAEADAETQTNLAVNNARAVLGVALTSAADAGKVKWVAC
jgi:hypothetical protein